MEMQPAVDEDLSSPPSEISSPPSSPPQTGLDSIAVAQRRPGEGVVNPAAASSAQPSSAAAHHTDNLLLTTINPPKPKRQRKPKEPKDAKPADPPKEKKTRKPREPRAKKDGEAATAAPRKRQKTDEKTTPAPAPADAPAGPRQSTILEMVNQHPQHPQPAYQQPAVPTPSRPLQMPPSESLLRTSLTPHAATPPPPRPFSSGQSYDPIRGLIIDAAPPPRPPAAAAAATTNGHLSAQASPHRASASPAVTSLIDPPAAPNTSAPGQIPYPAQTVLLSQHSQLPPSQQTQPTPTPLVALPKSPAPNVMPSQNSPPAPTTKDVPPLNDEAMDIDGPACNAPLTKPIPEIRAPSKASSSAAPTPKPVPAKSNSSPKGTGSGLLSSSDLFGGPSSSSGSDRQGVNIDIRIPLNPNGGNTINLAQEIAKKYGRDAVNPRAAAHRQRLLQVAAAANRLDGGSADDMSVDLLSEGEGDSNVEMGGIDDERSATGADEKPKRRKRKEEEYDKEDDFIDDTELAWQQQAAVTKDGFFVYSGPLVPEGQNAQIESATSTRGRGSGRGRGRGRAAAAAAAAAAANGTSHAAVAEKKEAGTGRGRGRGRGTGATRKPRITKADRERMEAEKAERERAALNVNVVPPPTTGGSMLTSSVSTSYAPPAQNTYNPQTATQTGVPA